SANRTGQICWIAGLRADDQVHRSPVHLSIRKKQMLARFVAKTPIFRATDNSDYLPGFIPKMQVLADRTLIWEFLSCQCIVDDYHRRRFLVVMIVEEPSGSQWDPHRSKIISAYLIHLRRWLVFLGYRRMLVDGIRI